MNVSESNTTSARIRETPQSTLSDLLLKSTPALSVAANFLKEKNISAAHGLVAPFMGDEFCTSAPMSEDKNLAGRRESAKAMLDWASNETNTNPYYMNDNFDTLHMLQDTVETGLWLADLLFDHTPQNTKASTPYTTEYMKFLRLCEKLGTAREGYAVGIKNEIQGLIRAASSTSPKVREERNSDYIKNSKETSSSEELAERKRRSGEKNAEWDLKQKQWEEEKRQEARQKYDDAVVKLRGVDLLKDTFPLVMTPDELKAAEAKGAAEKAAAVSESHRRKAVPINIGVANVIASIPDELRKTSYIAAASISTDLQNGQYQAAFDRLTAMKKNLISRDLPDAAADLDLLLKQLEELIPLI